MGVRYTNIYQDATSVPTIAGNTQYNCANPIPAGLIEEVGFRWTGVEGGGKLSASTFTELISGLRMTLNGDQWLNMQLSAGVNTNADVSRCVAMVMDMGGRVVEDPNALSCDTTVWIPCGINVPQNSRFELDLSFIASAFNFTAGQRFEIWVKYGKSTNATIVGNQTSFPLTAGAQTMVSVKIPTFKGATVAGIAIQADTAGADDLASLIVKPLGDFSYSPTYLRGISGANQNGYMFASSGVSATELQYADACEGYYFVPLYNLSVVDGSVVLLLTKGAGASATYTFTPILNLPTGGSGERTPVQTSQVATGSKGAILSRAEDI
jgi:hypothetical protein